jgi:DNA-binding XRE family transcriptional regulator
MLTKPSASKRRPGRPLPTPDHAAQRRAHRLTDAAEVGALLRLERSARGLTQAEMAARLGLSRQLLLALERGAEGAGIGLILRLLADLGVVVLAFPPAAMENLPAALGLVPASE